MKRIELQVLKNDTSELIRCNVIQGKLGWQCILFRENFQFQFVLESSLIHCLEVLAKYLEAMPDIVIFSENPTDVFYITIINNKMFEIKKERQEEARRQRLN